MNGARVRLSAGLTALALLALCGCCSCQRRPRETPTPSSSSVSSASYQPPSYAQGRFTVAMQDGRAWFVAPDGARFLSQGVSAIGSGEYRAPNPNFYNPVPKQFGGNKAAWAKSALERLASWGFNTVGAWSDDALYGKRYPYTFMLYAAGSEHPLEHVFDAGFEQLVAQNTAKAAAHKDDPYLIGYFLDNELPWWGEFGWHAGGQKTLLEKYARAPAGSGGKRALRDFLEQRYGKDIAHFNRVYGAASRAFDELEQPLELAVSNHAARRDADEFAGMVAERFLSVATQALRAIDDSHLILCVRFAGEAPWPVVQAAAKYCDVISVNQYQQSGDIDRASLDDIYAKTHKPILLTEYSFSATENQSGDPNTRGAMVTVKTQAERAEHATRFASDALALPYLVGLHWFEWADESPQGRFDGEDQNYGLVDLQDRPYELLTQAHRQLNHDAQAIHARASTALAATFHGEAQASLHAAAPLSAPRFYFQAGSEPKMYPWGDAANGGSSKVVVRPDATLLQFSSGTGWGTGVAISPASWPFDAGGATHLELVLEAPAGRTVQVLFNEAGAAAPGQASYAGRVGSDGEAYEFPSFTGTGKLETYVVELQELERRSSWGNQRGNQQLDLQALSTVDLYLPGKQGDGELRLVSIRFTR
ncbi:MAG TPA: beta-galactosidase [Polyangiaceae bacterium]|jgi:hypothetical protein|nr:beta-galactosidase [Polyangiaceae bacterium]